jgi:hypothetical protein
LRVEAYFNALTVFLSAHFLTEGKMQVIDKYTILARGGWFYIGLTWFAAVLTGIVFPVYIAL